MTSEHIALYKAAEMALEVMNIDAEYADNISWKRLTQIAAAGAALREALARPDQLEDCKKILIERTASLTKANYRLEQLSKQEPVAVVTEEMEFSNYQATGTGRLIIVPIKGMAESGLQNGDKLYLYPTPIPEGWQLVPKEPTPEMIEAASGYAASTVNSGKRPTIAGYYVAMLDVAPKPEELK